MNIPEVLVTGLPRHADLGRRGDRRLVQRRADVQPGRHDQGGSRRALTGRGPPRWHREAPQEGGSRRSRSSRPRSEPRSTLPLAPGLTRSCPRTASRPGAPLQDDAPRRHIQWLGPRLLRRAAMSRSRSRGPPLYLCGDNDLAKYLEDDFREICAAGASPSVHVAVQIDRPTGAARLPPARTAAAPSGGARPHARQCQHRRPERRHRLP